MPYAPVNGIQLYYESHGEGPGEGPATIFAHGAGGNHISWWQQVPVLSQHYRCITFDHRGWGASVDASGGPGAGAFVEDLKQLLDHLGVDKAFLVSQSMGGRACLGFALAYPQRTLGLVLGDTTGGVSDPAVLRLGEKPARNPILVAGFSRLGLSSSIPIGPSCTTRSGCSTRKDRQPPRPQAAPPAARRPPTWAGWRRSPPC